MEFGLAWWHGWERQAARLLGFYTLLIYFFPGDNLSKQKCVAFHQKVLVTPTTHQSEELCILLTFIHSSWLTRYYLPKGRKEECIVIAYCFPLVCVEEKKNENIVQWLLLWNFLYWFWLAAWWLCFLNSFGIFSGFPGFNLVVHLF